MNTMKVLLTSGLAMLAAVSVNASAQAYYPYNVADYPSTYGNYDYGSYPSYSQDYYGYGTSPSYGDAYGYSQYDSGYYANQAYDQQYYAQQPASPQQNYSYNYQQPASPQQNYAYNYQPPVYAYSQPSYPPQAYYYRGPSRNDGMKKMLKPEKWRGRNFGEEFWPGDESIYEDVLPVHGPWDRNWGKAPWNREYEDMWGDEGGPDAWMDFADPKEGLAWMWEDFLYTPHALGTMPGGWDAPTISVPNPIDVGDEFKDASGDFPGEVKDFADGFTYGDRTITGSKPKKDSGSIGFGKKKKDGINIQPKQR